MYPSGFLEGAACHHAPLLIKLFLQWSNILLSYPYQLLHHICFCALNHFTAHSGESNDV